jgi:hypothetical protein
MTILIRLWRLPVKLLLPTKSELGSWDAERKDCTKLGKSGKMGKWKS